jgi:hypothetical protein
MAENPASRDAERLEQLDAAFVGAVTGGDRVGAVRCLERALVARRDAFGLADARVAACAARCVRGGCAFCLQSIEPWARSRWLHQMVRHPHCLLWSPRDIKNDTG